MPSKYHLKDLPPERVAKYLKEILRSDDKSPFFEAWDYKQWTKDNSKLMETDKLVHYNIQRLAERFNEDRELYTLGDEIKSRFDSANVNTYSSMVKVGNWQEQRAVAEDDLNRFLRLRQRGQLMLQKTREIIGQNLKPINIAPKRFVCFGDDVQLIARNAKTFRERGKQEGLSLSCVLTGHPTAEMCLPLIEGTVLSASPLIAPCVRNVFKLQPWQDKHHVVREGDRLKFGQEFVLLYTGTPPSQPYFVSVNPIRIIPSGNNSRHAEVFLTSRKCWTNVWRAYDANPETRDENMGEYISGNYDVIVTNANVNRCLCCETESWFTTFFGLECEATAYTYYNIYGAEAPNNIWYFG